MKSTWNADARLRGREGEGCWATGKDQQLRIQKERGGTWLVHPRFPGTSELGQEGALNNRSPGLGWEGAAQGKAGCQEGLAVSPGCGAPSEGRVREDAAERGSPSLLTCSVYNASIPSDMCPGLQALGRLSSCVTSVIPQARCGEPVYPACRERNRLRSDRTVQREGHAARGWRA